MSVQVYKRLNYKISPDYTLTVSTDQGKKSRKFISEADLRTGAMQLTKELLNEQFKCYFTFVSTPVFEKPLPESTTIGISFAF